MVIQVDPRKAFGRSGYSKINVIIPFYFVCPQSKLDVCLSFPHMRHSNKISNFYLESSADVSI